MKRHLLIFTMLLGTFVLQGQNAGDQAAMLQKIVGLPELQQYFPKYADGSLKALVIQQYPFAFSQETVSLLNSKTVFMKADEIKSQRAEAYFSFRAVGMNEGAATVTGNYFYQYNHEAGKFKMLIINAELKRTGSAWSISKFNLGGDK